MSGYIRSVTKSFEFNGQTIVATIEPIEYQDFLGLQKIDGGADMQQAVAYIADIVRKYVKVITPPRSQDGTDITLEEICSKAYFMELLNAIGRAVIETGKVADPLA